MNFINGQKTFNSETIIFNIETINNSVLDFNFPAFIMFFNEYGL